VPTDLIPWAIAGLIACLATWIVVFYMILAGDPSNKD
jgi:hypothetical protein